MAEYAVGKYDDTPVAVAKAKMPDVTQPAESKQVPATLGARNQFVGWWPLLQRYGVLKTAHSRIIGNQEIPGNCSSTLRNQMSGLEYRIVTRDTKEATDETEFYTQVLDSARDEDGGLIGGSGLFDLMAQDILNARQGGNCEVVRMRGGRYDGVPIGLYAMDAATLLWRPRGKDDPEPIAQVSPDTGQVIRQASKEVRFAQDEVMHCVWTRYPVRGLQWYNRHPVQTAWVAINCLAAGDDLNYGILTEVIPQGLLNLGPGFTREKAMEWRDAWRAARQGGKLEDIGLLWGTDKAEFIRFNEPLKDQPYQHMSYWYLTVVTGSYGMSPLDIGFMTQLNTKAGAEVSAELSKNKGLAHLLHAIKGGVEYWILPPHLMLDWPDLDPTDEQVEADTRAANSQAITSAFAGGTGWIDRQQAQAEAVRLQVFELEVTDEEEAPPEEEGEGSGEGESAGEEDEEYNAGEEAEKAMRAAISLLPFAAKSHAASVVRMTCPLCGHDTADQYDLGHGGLCVCQGCHCTFDPEVEMAAVGVV